MQRATITIDDDLVARIDALWRRAVTPNRSGATRDLAAQAYRNRAS